MQGETEPGQMCEIGESLILVLKRTTDPQRKLGSRRPRRILHDRWVRTCVQANGFPVTDYYQPVHLATIPIQWSPEMLWPAYIRFTRPV